jgi:hypothetical protein
MEPFADTGGLYPERGFVNDSLCCGRSNALDASLVFNEGWASSEAVHDGFG